MFRLRVLARSVVPLAVIAAGLYIHAAPATIWLYVYRLALWFVMAVWVAVVVGGRLRNVATIVASVLLFLTVAEAYAVVTLSRPIDINTPGYAVPLPILGWGPQPGVFHHTKIEAKTKRIIADVDSTIDAHGHRRVDSAQEGPTVAFFGDSMTFGAGLADSETLPQHFADVSGRRLHVVNLAFNGYGPQQFLRALETDLAKDVLTEPRLFVFLTAPWHALRTACKTTFMMRAPRYELIGGRPTFQGTCDGQRSIRLLLYRLMAERATYNVFIDPIMSRVRPADIDLYVSILIRAGQLAREKYGVPTVILYLPADDFARLAGTSDEEIMRRLSDGGLIVINAGLDQSAFPGQPLAIPGDGHPTGVANLARAKLLYGALDKVVLQTR